MEPFSGAFELVDPRLIVVDHRYQRPEKQALIDRISTEFKWTSFGTVTCYRRNGVLYAVDGQQRLQAALQQDPVPKAVPTIVYPEETIQKEAKTFLDIQVNRKAVTALEKHKASILAKDPPTLAIVRAVEAAGFQIGEDAYDAKQIAAVRTLHKIYEDIGEEGVLQTLVQVRDAWGEDRAAITAPMLRGVGDVLEDLGDGYERAKVTAALRRSDPAALMRQSSAFRFEMGGSRRVNMRRAIQKLCRI